MITRNVYTVGQVNSYIKNMFSQDYMLNRIYVKGEVSNCKYHTSGHIYFTLKDERGTIACVMFAGQRAGLGFRMEEGHKVIVLGSVNVYERDGTYQIYAREIQQDGQGDLYRQYQKLKQELEDMGMFAPEYKQAIPQYAAKVGIVTAPTGAAVRDIMNIAARRNPCVQLVLYPALVQGEGAAQSIVEGIRALDAYGVDVMIVGRGGGSIEDLWAFNEEAVARAVFECRTPVISAVGHETDYTIIDFAADMRAPTPSAAAELAVYEKKAAVNQLQQARNWLNGRMEQLLERKRQLLEQYELRLRHVSPEYRLREQQQYLMQLEEKLQLCMERCLTNEKHRLALYAGKLDGLSPLAKLRQGYAYVTGGDGKALTDASEVKKNDTVCVHLRNGVIESTVRKVSLIEREEP